MSTFFLIFVIFFIAFGGYKMHRAWQGWEGLLVSYYPKDDHTEKYPPNIGGLILWGFIVLMMVLLFLNEFFPISF